MKTDAPVYVLDTHAVLAYLNQEPAGGAVREKLAEAAAQSCRLLMSAMTMCEACYLIERRKGLGDVEAFLALVEDLPLEVADIDRASVLGAARIKAGYLMSLGDAFVAALALDRGATVVTGDKEFRRTEGLVPVMWLQG